MNGIQVFALDETQAGCLIVPLDHDAAVQPEMIAGDLLGNPAFRTRLELKNLCALLFADDQA